MKNWLMCMFAFATMMAFAAGCGGDKEIEADDDDATAAEAPTPPSTGYVVQSGDSLWTIAENAQVDWLQLAATNRSYLVERYDARCTLLRERYRQRRTRGYYCNDNRADTWSNSLKPGDTLHIPSAMPAEAPAAVQEMIRAIEEAPEPIAVVVDDTGSMSDDRQVVMDWYLAIARQQQKQVVGVWLYSDGNVEYINPRGTVELATTGGLENTHGAIRAAANSRPRPSSILLITDEQGDDWEWENMGGMPPVFGHCLSEYGGGFSCEPNLRRLARETGGGYIRGAH